jgi:phosphoribosylformylglycinamidine cyclo-ligase
MVIILAKSEADKALASLQGQGLKAWVVGEVVERPHNAAQTIVI